MDEERHKEMVAAIGKNRGTVKLSLTNSIPVVSAVEGDTTNTWHLCVSRPYRSLKYGKQLPEWDAVRELRKVMKHHERAARAIQREINWITGEPQYDNGI